MRVPWSVRLRVMGVIMLILVIALATLPGSGSAAQPGVRGVVTISVATLSPIVALIAGILILLVPRLLNFTVAVYLILVGLIGLLGR